jgi:hypothetical protein
MTVKELKKIINSIPSEYDNNTLFTDISSDEYAEIADLVRIAEPKISGYKIPKDYFYISLRLK